MTSAVAPLIALRKNTAPFPLAPRAPLTWSLTPGESAAAPPPSPLPRAYSCAAADIDPRFAAPFQLAAPEAKVYARPSLPRPDSSPAWSAHDTAFDEDLTAYVYLWLLSRTECSTGSASNSPWALQGRFRPSTLQVEPPRPPLYVAAS